MPEDLNQTILVGRLTKDPELRHTPSGTAVCKIRLAFTTRGKDSSGEWSDRSNFINVTVWGRQGENLAQYQSKGKRIGVRGRLEWREWEASDGSGKRQDIEVIADHVQYLDSRSQNGDSGGYAGDASQYDAATPAGGSEDFGTPTGGTLPGANADDDIPF